MHNEVSGHEFTIKRLSVKGKNVSLLPENDKYEPIPTSQACDFTTWGVVKHSIWRL